jgi:kinesin family protein 6/9
LTDFLVLLILAWQVQQRDVEIGILVKMLHQQGSQVAGTGAAAGSLSSSSVASMPHQGCLEGLSQQQQCSAAATNSRGTTGHTGELLSALLDVNLLADRNKAFEVFRRSYRQNEVGRFIKYNILVVLFYNHHEQV